MKCKDCPRWQGLRNYSTWGDCHYVAFEVVNDLYYCLKYNGFGLFPPLDPHDFKYVASETAPNFHNIKIPKGVRIEYELVEDVWYNSNGEERVRKIQLPHFQTRKDYRCDTMCPLMP